jgi:glutamyl-tRNA reductase
MSSMLNKLPGLGEREVDVIRKLTKSMLNQMMRDPIMRVKELAAERRGEEALDMFTHLFALEQRLADAASAEEARKAAVKAAAAEQQSKEAIVGPDDRDRKQRIAIAAGELLAHS